MTAITPEFNDIIHAPHRLKICAVLNTVSQAEFALLREVTGVSESVLSKQVKVLEDAGYVATTKGPRGGRVRTWAAFTPAGRKAYRAHVAELKALVGDA